MDTLFLDRDGVINVQLVGDYVKCADELLLRDDFLRAIPLLKKHFKRFIVITNQQGIAKGICTTEQVNAVHQYLRQQLADNKLIINAIYFCPHLAGSGCDCRKPETGMMRQALADFPDIRLDQSFMVGDSLTDMQFGKRAGVPTAFIGKVTQENRADVLANSTLIVSSVFEFAQKL